MCSKLTTLLYIHKYIYRESARNVGVRLQTLFSASDSASFLISISLSSDNLSASVCGEKDRQNKIILFQTENKIMLITPLADYFACFKQKLT